MAKKPKSKLEQFLGDPEKMHYCSAGQMIFAKDKKRGDQMILDVRGWGAIQHLFDDEEEAAKFQDELGEFYVEAIKEKLIKLRQKDK
ncbi:MAG: hypothetical protein GY827_04785 [Cytophagales bacterium]|nr:hypothetical protein [Cytophagales bacterium]